MYTMTKRPFNEKELEYVMNTTGFASLSSIEEEGVSNVEQKCQVMKKWRII